MVLSVPAEIWTSHLGDKILLPQPFALFQSNGKHYFWIYKPALLPKRTAFPLTLLCRVSDPVTTLTAVNTSQLNKQNKNLTSQQSTMYRANGAFLPHEYRALLKLTQFLFAQNKWVHCTGFRGMFFISSLFYIYGVHFTRAETLQLPPGPNACNLPVFEMQPSTITDEHKPCVL